MAPLLTLTTSARTIRLRIDWMATVANASPAVSLWDPDGLPVGSRATDDDRARHGDLPGVSCFAQETSPAGAGKPRMKASPITNADNPLGR